MAILTRGVKLSELGSQNDVQRSETMSNLFRSACKPTEDELHAQLDELSREVLDYETRYRMTSDDMKRKLVQGELKESADICSWLMLELTATDLIDLLPTKKLTEPFFSN